MPYTSSPYPEDYPTRDVYKGINIYNTIPNRYPYMYDRQPFPGLYYDDLPPHSKRRRYFETDTRGCCPSRGDGIVGGGDSPTIENHGEPIRRTPKVFPYTNRPWLESTVYTPPQYYESLLDSERLRPAYTFYKSECFLL